MMPHDLSRHWRSEADLFERYGDAGKAKMCRAHADDLDAALADEANAALDLAQAADESGYSPDRLRHMVAAGQIPNAGRKGAPRIRRADLPRKRPTSGGAFDAGAVALNLLKTGTDD